jgi:hypothetical protein
MNTNNYNKQLCEKGFLLYLSSRHWQFMLMVAKRKLSSLWMQMAAHVLQVLRAGRDAAQAQIMAATANKRIFIGLGLMGVVAPLAACLYLLFDRVEVDKGWYYLNYFHLFFVLGPHIAYIVAFVGIFYLFPFMSKRSYLMALPTGWNIAKIVWLISATSNEAFWQPVPKSLYLIGGLVALVFYLTHDWLTWRFFHRFDSFKAREKGLYQIVNDVPADKFVSMWKVYYEQKNNFQREF